MAEDDDLLTMRGESFEFGRVEGAREEREAAVIWLKNQIGMLSGTGWTADGEWVIRANEVEELAGGIEAGKHRTAPDA